MPEIKGGTELINIYNPSRRKQLNLEVDWKFLHVTAMNVASLVARLHQDGYVLGDIKPQNILVNNQALPSIIDTDSFQVRDSKTGKIYRCTVGTEGFTPPELIGKDLSQIDQTVYHDAFRLGVLIYYFLLGQSPFAGDWKGPGDPPEPTEKIRRGLWVYGQDNLVAPGHLTIYLDAIYPDIRTLFLECFNQDRNVLALRPKASIWASALNKAITELVICDRVEGHFYYKCQGQCIWCERLNQVGADIFNIPIFLERRQERLSRSNSKNISSSCNITTQASKNQTQSTSLAQNQKYQKIIRLTLLSSFCLYLIYLFFSNISGLVFPERDHIRKTNNSTSYILDLPKLNQGMPYSEARDLLLSLG